MTDKDINRDAILDTSVDVDPNKLTVNEEGNALGFEKLGGFEQMTNFALKITGYVGDGQGSVIGYVLGIILAVVDPLDPKTENISSQIYLTNRELGNHTTIINTLTKIPALWIAQSKETFLPQYIYNLCKDYISSENGRKRYEPVKIIGKQPGKNIWVFNEKVHMDEDGALIPVEDRSFLMSKDCKLPQIPDVLGDLDNGDALRELMLAEQDLFQNNFAQVLIGHAASGLASNYDLLISEFGGCPTPVIKGEPLSGKTTALTAILSVFGIDDFSSECSSKFIEKMQSMTTIPFGWDDSSNLQSMKNVTVNSYNAAGSANMITSLKPHTVPIITTNKQCSETKIKSRWLPILFEELSPKLSGVTLLKAQKNLRRKMKKAYRSIPVVTSYLHSKISKYETDEDYLHIQDNLQREIAENSLKLDQRIFESIVLTKFCSKKILQKLDLSQFDDLVWKKLTGVILPSYCNNFTEQGNENAEKNQDKITNFLQQLLLSAVLKTDPEDALKFFDQEFKPKTCTCGLVVVFNVKKAVECVEFVHGSTGVVGITEEAIRAYVKSSGIGCTGRQVKFRKSERAGQQLRAVHIRREWFNSDILKELDAKLGRRVRENKEGKQDKLTPRDRGNEEHNLITINDESTQSNAESNNESELFVTYVDAQKTANDHDESTKSSDSCEQSELSDEHVDLQNDDMTKSNGNCTHSTVDEESTSQAELAGYDTGVKDKTKVSGRKRRNKTNALEDNLSKNFTPCAWKRRR